MRVYLVGECGGTTAFKITTAKVLTCIDSILEEMFINAMTDTWYGKTTVQKIVISRVGYVYNIYYAELDEEIKTAKKLTGKVWKEVVDDYVSRNRDKVKAYNDRYKKSLKAKEGE